MFKFILAALVFTSPALAQVNAIQPDVIETWSGFKNYVQNPSARVNTRFTSVTSAALTRDTGAGNKIDNVASFSCDASALNGFCEFSLAPINTPDDVGNCEASLFFKGDATLYSLQILDGSNNVLNQTGALTNESAWKQAVTSYPCGSSRKIRLTQITAGTAPAVNVGRVYYGKITDLSSQIVVSDWRSYTISALGASVTAPAFATSPQINEARWRRVGDSVEIEWVYTHTSSTGATAGSGVYLFPLPPNLTIDSTKINVSTSSYANAGEMFIQNAGASAKFTLSPYSTTQLYAQGFFVNNTPGNPGNVTWGSAGFALTDSTQRYSLKARVPISGWSGSSVAVRMDQSNYDWVSYTPTFTGFGTVTSPECQHKRDGADLLIRCKFTSGTSTATEARVSLPGSLVAAGTSKIPSIQRVGDLTRGVSAGSQWHVHVLQEPAVSYMTFGVQGNAAAGMTKAQGSSVVGSSETVSFTARIPIEGWFENQNAPLLVGGVTSNTSGQERIERATISCSSSASITSQSGSWISSIGNISSGKCSLTIGSGIFSATPTCTATSLDYGSSLILAPVVSPSSPTSVAIGCTFALSGSSTINYCVGPNVFYVQCMGPR